MKPVKVAILWHKHQPLYSYKDGFLLPWTRLHGVKDYFDLPEVLHEFPKVKQTFNLVPSMMMQIEDYIFAKQEDKVLRLSKIPADMLNMKQKAEILNLFFLCHVDNMVMPYGRYRDLYERSRNHDAALANFTAQDFRDLQVWYNLTWFGPYSKENIAVKRFFDKGGNFTEEEKLFILDKHIELLKRVTGQMKSLQDLNQIELSCSPMYHPIIPLVCDSESAKQAMPNVPMPNPLYKYPEDAEWHISNALKYTEHIFSQRPNGMWPSEGSVSNKALELFAKNKVRWVATDEEILRKTKGGLNKEVDKFFPRKFNTPEGEISVFFRDHFLSDRIGFVYSNWDGSQAADDFCNHIKNIRSEIIKIYGEDALDHAVVPIILDGENCWEYYFDNGRPFLRELYSRFTEMEEITTVTMSEAISKRENEFLPPLDSIYSGSWINANFSIWIGDEDDRKAWNMLGEARELAESLKGRLPQDQWERAMNELYIAEGSDWYWWYGPEHSAENKSDFDELFRWHLMEFYRIADKEVPEYLTQPISAQESVLLQHPKTTIDPIISGFRDEKTGWEGAGIFNAVGAMSAMHQIGELLKRVFWGNKGNRIFFRLEPGNDLGDNEYLKMQIDNACEIKISKTGLEIISCESKISYFHYEDKGVPEIAIEFEGIRPEDVCFASFSSGSEIRYPQKGTYKLNLVD